MRALRLFFVIALSAAAAAQQRPLFDPSDFVDPRLHAEPGFVSRLTIGGVWNFEDDYRPARQDVGLIHVANSIYWSHFQFAYKRTEIRGAESGTVRVQQCGCLPGVFFPTPPPPNATPAAPPPGSKNTLQFSWYQLAASSKPNAPIMLRYRLTWTRQPIDTVIATVQTNEPPSRRSGHEQSIGVDADTYVRVAGHDVFGSVVFARTTQAGTINPRAQNELTYTNRFRAVALGPVLVRAAIAVGGISNRGGTAINLLNPYFEAFWHHDATEVNLHLVYSMQAMNSGLEGWRKHHQIALVADRALFVKLFH